MFSSQEYNPVVETRQPKVEFDWEKHLKAEWGEPNFLKKELKGLVIEGPKGSVDVLKLVNAQKVFLKYTGEKGGNLIVSSGEVEINKFDDVIDLALLMHEFGHFDQFINENFDSKILKLVIDVKIKKKSDDAKARVDTFKQVIEMFPEVRPLIRSGLIDNKNSEEVVDLPEKIMERDATARALKWLREISEKTGIDFFRKFKIEEDKEFSWEKELDDCQNSVQEGMANPNQFEETDVVKEMNNWLKSYHAESLTDTYDPAKTGKRIKPKLDTK